MIYVICVCLHTVVSNTYYVVVLFCLSSPCVLCCLHLVSCYLQLFVGLMCDLHYLCLFTYGVSTHIMLWFCFVCLHLVSCYLQLFVGGIMCDLCYLCLFTYGGVQHILCCGFVLFVFTLCLVLSSPCVLLPPVVCRRDSCVIYVICVCLHTVVSNTYYVVVLFCLSSPCVLCCLHLVSCYLQLFVGGLMCDLCYLCLFTYGGVQHILCCGFVLFVFTLCLVLSSPCVLLPPVVCRRTHV